MDLQEPLPARIIKQDLVAIHLPDRSKLCRSRPVQAEVNSTGFTSPHQNPFCHGKCLGPQLMMTAKCCVDVFSKITDAFDLLKTGQHGWQLSPDIPGRPIGLVKVGRQGWALTRRVSALCEDNFGWEPRAILSDRRRSADTLIRLLTAKIGTQIRKAQPVGVAGGASLASVNHAAPRRSSLLSLVRASFNSASSSSTFCCNCLDRACSRRNFSSNAAY